MFYSFFYNADFIYKKRVSGSSNKYKFILVLRSGYMALCVIPIETILKFMIDTIFIGFIPSFYNDLDELELSDSDGLFHSSCITLCVIPLETIF